MPQFKIFRSIHYWWHYAIWKIKLQLHVVDNSQIEMSDSLWSETQWDLWRTNKSSIFGRRLTDASNFAGGLGRSAQSAGQVWGSGEGVWLAKMAFAKFMKSGKMQIGKYRLLECYYKKTGPGSHPGPQKPKLHIKWLTIRKAITKLVEKSWAINTNVIEFFISLVYSP